MDIQVSKDEGESTVRNIGNTINALLSKHWQKAATALALVFSNFLTFGIAKRYYEKKLATTREALRRHEEKIRSGECDERQKKELERQCRILREQLKKYAEKCGETGNDD